MAQNTTSSRTVFVLGKEVAGNRQVFIVESGQEYSVYATAILPYTDATAKFPYNINI